MQFRKLFAAIATSLAVAVGAAAQTPPSAPDAGTAASPGAAQKPKKRSKSKSKSDAKTSKKKKKSLRKGKGQKAVPLPDDTRKALEVVPPPVAPAQPPQEVYAGPEDNDPPSLAHTPVAAATRGKAFLVTAHAEDPSGIFGPVLYLRKKGLSATDFIPMRMTPARSGVPGDYALEIPGALTGVDALEYYLEVWDNAGNGPVRAGSAETPFTVKVEEEKKIVVKPIEPTPPTAVTVRPKGAPPAISHVAVTQATRGQPVELEARLTSETGVQGATVMFRRVGEKEYRSLPMGNFGGDSYTATIPARLVTSDLEYYLEAFDKQGNGPGRTGAPSAPFLVKVSAPAPLVPVKAAEDDYTLTHVGLQLDAGAPGGGGVLLLLRPAWWVRFNAGLAYNVIGFGYRGGISLSPGHFAVTPTLNLDAGHYVSGDANRFFKPSDPNPAVVAAEVSLLSHATYTFASAQLGLEFGSQRRFAFYLRGGLAYLETSASGADITALANSKVASGGNGTTYALGDAKFTSIMPTAGLGFLLFVY